VADFLSGFRNNNIFTIRLVNYCDLFSFSVRSRYIRKYFHILAPLLLMMIIANACGGEEEEERASTTIDYNNSAAYCWNNKLK